MSAFARLGLVSRGLIYLVIGWLAVQIARGHGTHQANQSGALSAVAQHPFGILLLWVLAFGFATYAIWRLSEAAYGTAADGRKAGPRAQSLASGLVYGALAVSAFLFIAGRPRRAQAQQQETVTASVMKHQGGRWLIGAAGVIVVVVGLAMVIDGARQKLLRELQTDAMSRATRAGISGLGVIGAVARGVVVAVAGALVIEAAVRFDPAKSTGLDGALRDLAGHTYGTWLLGAVAAGLIAFGLFGLAAARWART